MSAQLKPTPTAADVSAALRGRFSAPEWAIMFGVPNATGAGPSRIADAIAMTLWPSRGLEIHGFEVKIARGDWRRERAQPEKAETIAAYCDRWWLVTTPHVVQDVSEIPPNWGWLELIGGKLMTRLQAGKNQHTKVLDRGFVASMLRSSGVAGDAEIGALVNKRMANYEARRAEDIRRLAESMTRDGQRAVDILKEIGEAIGLDLSWKDKKEVAAAIGLVLRVGVTSVHNGIEQMARAAEGNAEMLRAAMKDFKVGADG